MLSQKVNTDTYIQSVNITSQKMTFKFSKVKVTFFFISYIMDQKNTKHKH